MKKNILKVALVVAFALSVGYTVYNSQEDEVLSDLMLINAEALASESDDWYCVGESNVCLKDDQGTIHGKKYNIQIF